VQLNKYLFMICIGFFFFGNLQHVVQMSWWLMLIVIIKSVTIHLSINSRIIYLKNK